MSQRSTLVTLQALAKREADSAARQLSAAIEQHGHARQRLSMLSDLRTDYAQRLQQQHAEGLSMMAIRNGHACHGKIDDAIAGQKKLEAAATTRVEQARACWQAKQRREKTWESLIRRGVHADAVRLLKQERKLMDELASRTGRHRRGESGTDGDA